jgi:hypothetical protein
MRVTSLQVADDIGPQTKNGAPDGIAVLHLPAIS